MKRPFLGLLAAATLMFGVADIAPAGAAASDTTAAAVAPAHDGDSEGPQRYSHPHGGGQPTRHHDRQFYGGNDDHGYGHDGNGDGHGRRRRCEGLIVICLV